MRDCPNIVAKGMNARQAPYSGPSVDGQARNRFMLSKLTRKQIRMKVPDQNVQVRIPGTTLRVPEEDPNPWREWLRVADLLHQWPKGSPASRRHRRLYCLEFNFQKTCGNTSASRTCFPTKSTKIKLKLDLFKKVQRSEG
uniref:Uncharacterized protein n=1 Tax=Solanum tuberosum TaxID=4113 RepID=M1DWS7_SOLTU